MTEREETPDILIENIKTLVLKRALYFDSLNTITTKMTTHIPKVVEWTTWLCEEYPQADKRTAVLGAWLHDVGHLWSTFCPEEEDHAVHGALKAKVILKAFSTDTETVKKVAAIVRCHRNNDVPPVTLEERIVAAADSASHFSEDVHMRIADDGRFTNPQARAEYALGKLERDFRDTSAFPQLSEKLKEQYGKIKEILLKILCRLP